jgi:hypothetical protein
MCTCPAHVASCVRSPACVLCRSPMADLEQAVKMLQGAQQSLHLLARSPVIFIILIIVCVSVCLCVCLSLPLSVYYIFFIIFIAASPCSLSGLAPPHPWARPRTTWRDSAAAPPSRFTATTQMASASCCICALCENAGVVPQRLLGLFFKIAQPRHHA